MSSGMTVQHSSFFPHHFFNQPHNGFGSGMVVSPLEDGQLDPVWSQAVCEWTGE